MPSHEQCSLNAKFKPLFANTYYPLGTILGTSVVNDPLPGAKVKTAMGKITVFTVDSCPYCERAKDLLTSKGADFQEISLTSMPEWRHFMFLLANGEQDHTQYRSMIKNYDSV